MRRWRSLPLWVMTGVLIGHLAGSVPVDHAFEMGASARGLGLGGAFVALVDDETAVVHNPAALGMLSSIGLSSFYARQFAGVTYGSLCVAMPWVGMGVSLVDSGPIPSSDGSLRYASQSYALSAGLPLGPVAFGVRWRSLRVTAPTRGHGWSLDPSLIVHAGSLRLGVLLESAISAPVTYASGHRESFAPSLRMGLAAMLSPAPDIWWNASFEAVGLFAGDPAFRAGLEAWIGEIGARVGYDGDGATVGLTLRVAGIQLDWAYATRTDLGDSHRVSLSLRF